MRDPITPSLLEDLLIKYDRTCRGFDPHSPHLADLRTSQQSDRDLYSFLIGRIGTEFRKSGEISFASYRALLYWKLYSQPAAIAKIVKPLSRTETHRSVEAALHQFKTIFPARIERDSAAVCRLITGMGGLKLHGFKTGRTYPVRSTVLHFLYPHDIPVFDIKVLEAVGVEDAKELDANHDLDFFRRYIEHAWVLERKHLDALSAFPGLTPLRVLDMALWVERGGMKVPTRRSRTHNPQKGASIMRLLKDVPVIPQEGRSNPPHLRGLIRSLVKFASDGWERREIIVEQPNTDGFPQIRDEIVVIDSENVRYTLPFIKGANRDGYVCMGKPGRLKDWFMKHYPDKRVTADEVYFELTSDKTTYRIYTSRQWCEKR